MWLDVLDAIEKSELNCIFPFLFEMLSVKVVKVK